MSNSPIMTYFHEYIFYQAIQELNFNRQNKQLPLVRTSEARALHSEVMKKLGTGIGDVRRNRYFTAINETMQELNGGPMYAIEDFKDKYDAYTKDFSALTGINYEKDVSCPMLPLSPYDSRFMHRSAFLRNGNAMLYADMKEMEANGHKIGSDYDLNQEVELLKPNMSGGFNSAGRALSEDDLSGMSALAPYMSKREYEAVAPWVNQVGADDPSQYMSSDAVERAVAILQELQASGTPYSIVTDSRIGQIQAKIGGTKMSVRLTDCRNDEQYVGRVYDDGVTYYYTSADKIPRANSKSGPYKSQTVDDTIRLLRFAQGKPIDDFNGQKTGSPFQYKERIRGRMENVNSSYRSSGSFSVLMGDDSKNPDQRVRLYANSSRSLSAMRFQTKEAAEIELQGWVESARRNFANEINIDMLIDEAKQHAGEEDYVPPLSGDNGIAAIQQSYWEVLNGRTKALLKPGFESDEYNMREQVLRDWELRDTQLGHNAMSAIMYMGSPEEQVRAHLKDNTDYLIGSYEPDSNGKRFDPVNVVSYMTSANGRYRNNDNMISAIKAAEIPVDELKGDDFYNNMIRDKLIKFDPSTAKPMGSVSNPFIQSMYSTLKETIEQTGCFVDDKDVLIDDNGVVHYTAQMATAKSVKDNNGHMSTIEGEIGQIFVPDGKGMVETKFAGGNNYLFVPGYEAYVVPQKPGENQSMEERTRLRGYEQIMKETIQYRVRADLLVHSNTVGSTTGLNSAYRRLYDTRYPLDLFDRARMDGMDDTLLNQIIETNARRVRYGNELRDGSTINADFRRSSGRMNDDELNDNFNDPFKLTGYRNMSIMSEQGDGYFDKSATGTSTNQGITRYLVESAQVTPDGRIIPGDKDDKTPLMKNEACAYLDYVPFDRRQMTFNNLLKASCVAKEIHTAQMTFGGWTFDDGYVVSKKFAETYKIRGVDGQMRPLTVGDKISDMNGNKGVISLVVDPDMELDEAEKQGIREPVAWFKANKGHLDVVGAPFPAPSRFNGGSARELMRNPVDLIGPDGKTYEGCVGQASYIITHMSVDEKTHVYGEDELAKGKGRKASAQLAWALASHNATDVLKECYGSNNGSIANLREMLITMGLDMDETGTLRNEYMPHSGETRKVFVMPDLKYKPDSKTKDGRQILDVGLMKREFGNVIMSSGGVLEMPFALKYPTGDSTPNLNQSKTDVVHSGSNEPAGNTYGLPILSAYLRSGQEFADGTSSVHDYTNQYLSIYENAIKYRDAESRGDKASMAQYRNAAQSDFNKITGDLKRRKFEGKHNVFRDNIMANRMPHSATAVWTADPRLDIDEIAIGPGLKEALGVEKDGDYITIWRDPVLRDAGVRYMRAKIDDRLIGCAVNPAMDKSFDGDFDGDSVGLLALQSKAAKKEAEEKLTIEATLLDFGVRREDNPECPYGLMMQNSLDLKSAEFARPELKERREALEKQANDINRNVVAAQKRAFMSPEAAAKADREQPLMSEEQVKAARTSIVRELSDYVHDAFSHEYGTDMICFKDMKSHMKSVEHMVIDGAKGSYSKLKDYAKYLGIEYEQVPESKDPATPIDLDTIKDLGKPAATREDDLDVQYATSVKAFGTGVAGMYSQRGISVCRNGAPKAVLELTYPVTQGTLQSKHDAIDAKRRYSLIMGPVRALWQGAKMERVKNPDGTMQWAPVKDPENPGQFVRATPEEFQQQFMDIFTSKNGMGVEVNKFYVSRISRMLTDDKTGRMMNIEDEGREKFAAPLDRLAYGGSFDELKQLADKGTDLFAGKYNRFFQPSSIRKNVARKEQNLETVAISKSDTAVDYEKPKAKSNVVTVPSVRPVSKTLQKDTAAVSPETPVAANVSENVVPARKLQPVVRKHTGDYTAELAAGEAGSQTECTVPAC